jgi:hypothetical protein
MQGQNTKAITGGLHYGGLWPNNLYKGSGAHAETIDLSADYHVYSFEWDTKNMTWAVDGKIFYSQQVNRMWNDGKTKAQNPYTAVGQPWDQKFFLVIDLIVGGNTFTGSLNYADAQKWSSPRLFIDYVRIYKPTTSSNKEMEGTDNIDGSDVAILDDLFAEPEANTNNEQSSSSNKTAIIAGSVVGVVAGVALAALIAVVAVRRIQGKNVLPARKSDVTVSSTSSTSEIPAENQLQSQDSASSLTLESVNSSSSLLPEH